jgi:predicted NBD/HSP70 family sugar kinase/transcriptional regulator with XRE-family HTH domain
MTKDESAGLGADWETGDSFAEMRAEVEKSPRATALYHAAMHRTALLAAGPEIRKKQKLSQTEVAARMGTTQSAVSDLEAGRVEPQLRTLQRYAQAIGQRLDVAFVDEARPDVAGDELWSQLARTALSPLLVALATKGDEGVSLSALAESVSLPVPFVRPILSDLEAQGWATSREHHENPVYTMLKQGAFVIGISLTRGRVTGVLMNLNGDVEKNVTSAPVDSTTSEVMATTVDVVAQLYRQRGPHEVVGVGISIAGVVDVSEGSEGTVRFAPDLQSAYDPWLNVNLEHELQEAIQARVDTSLLVAVENDANALATREYLRRGDDSVVVLLLSGGGIGAGVVVCGNVVYGAHSAAGEGGHTIMNPDGPDCRTGLPHKGCLESIATADGIIAQLGISCGDLEKGLAVADDRVETGDGPAIAAFTTAGKTLGSYLANILVLLDPARAVLYAHRELADSERHAAARVFQEAVRTARDSAASGQGRAVELPQLEWLALEPTTNAVAAGFAAMRHFLAKPARWAPHVFAPTEFERVTTG